MFCKHCGPSGGKVPRENFNFQPEQLHELMGESLPNPSCKVPFIIIYVEWRYLCVLENIFV